MMIQDSAIPNDPVRLSGHLWGITAYFNPAGYSTKLSNLQRFAQGVRRQGLKLLVVELAFADSAFTLSEGLADSIVRVRSDAILWQKERLLNIGIEHLPDTCDKVAWLDGDILFTNEDWVEETSQMLEQYRIVQPYDTAVYLPPGGEIQVDLDLPVETHSMPGMAFAAAHHCGDNDIVRRRFEAHAGFAWSARRNILNAHGIYDRCIVGGGDYVSTLSMYFDSKIWANHNRNGLFSPSQVLDLSRWTDAFYNEVRGSVGYIHGSALHLWHGKLSHRQYTERYTALREFHFDPQLDIALNSHGCWSWSSDKPELHRRVKEYFWGRKEDG